MLIVIPTHFHTTLTSLERMVRSLMTDCLFDATPRLQKSDRRAHKICAGSHESWNNNRAPFGWSLGSIIKARRCLS
jgi:hypothetical protein